MRTPHTLPGKHEPLGATWDEAGTNFAIYSEHASGVELCLFDSEGTETRVRLRHRSEFVWHVYVKGIGPGQRYGYRVDGAWEPERGLRFNPANVLLDPYARALAGVERWPKGAFAYDLNSPDKDLVRSRENQGAAPRGVVLDGTFEWGDDRRPEIPLRRSVIYEAHVRGLTMRHPDVPPEERGTYLGLSSAPMLRYLSELGITAVELMPVHGFVDDQHLLARRLRNYWGYNSIAFFAPDVRYRSGSEVGAEVHQFKRMVKALHAAGIEVILDVVYNHTAEGNHLGPTFSFRGIDNPTYYRLAADQPRYYVDYTGTGNTLNVYHPQTLKLVMDSLRYWVTEMHVDGFRFDLASALARGAAEVSELSSFLTVIRQDPIVGGRKLIAEPWDLGAAGYQVGRFPLHWAEWNGKYRDTMRSFWRGDGDTAAELGYRLTGSSDLYGGAGRSPSSSINFITAHDGFTLQDLVSFDQKHNQANGDENRDGTEDNRSWNCGAEGATDDPVVLALRRRQARNLLATLFLSQGTPMLCGGDELGRTQRGNNNAYCQDGELTWHDWSPLVAPPDDPRRQLLEFTRKLIHLRREHPLIERANFFNGREIQSVGVRDLVWFRHDGRSMTAQDWANAGTSSLGMFMAGSGLDPTDESGRAQGDDDLLLALNASDTDLEFVLPAFVERGRALGWALLLDTSDEPVSSSGSSRTVQGEQVDPGSITKLPRRSLKLFRRKALGPGGLQSAYGAPVSTYRLQLRPGFGFGEAHELVGYLDELGVGGLYSSPILRPTRGSVHGYDVVDHSTLNPELGSHEAFWALTDELKRRGLRHVMDVVPNHVGIGSGENPWWTDVLENGPSSVFADFFDIEWHPPAATLQNRVLLPVLGRQFGEEIDDGRLGLRREGGSLWVTYYERRFPLAPRAYLEVLDRAQPGLGLPIADRWCQEFESIRASLRHLPPPTVVAPAKRLERSRETEVIKRRLQAVCEGSAAVAAAVDGALAGISASPKQLEHLLGEQNYRLSYWRVATEEINYRRFFDINDLAAIRMEDPAVFAAAHEVVLDLLKQGRVTGLRLDHVDGLYDPADYFQNLQSSAREALRSGGLPADAPLYVVAEKICAAGEELPGAWAISGTTGYDYLALANGLFIDPAAEQPLTRLYGEFTGSSVDYPSLLAQSKRDVLEGSFASEINMLGHALKVVADSSRRARDFTLPSLTRALKTLIAALPVYRTYLRPEGSRQKNDESHVRDAIVRAQQANPALEGSVLDFLGDVLLLRERSPEAINCAMKFQQLSGPIMAKGAEDTAFYRYQRLVALNEVGGDPSRFGSSPAEFHAHNRSMLGGWPLTLTASSTHDTKRSEDVRARLAVLSEVPEEWARFVAKFDSLARGAAQAAEKGAAAERGVSMVRADAYLFYQELVGAWPLDGLRDPIAGSAFTDRMVEHMRKAVREARLRSSWTQPNESYDAAVERQVRSVLASAPALAAMRDFVDSIAVAGACNSLAQVALRLASPGVPDIYQGCESWSFTLVDPDNRRPVDYVRLRSQLKELNARGAASPELAGALLADYASGLVKLHVTATALRLRREMAPLFLEGIYQPLEAGDKLVAFERRAEGRRLICAVPRLSRSLTRARGVWPLGALWGESAIEVGEAGHFRTVFTGERLSGGSLRLSEVFAHFPVAWLLEEGRG